MSDLVQLIKDNGIAVITINNPPVNALSPGVPEGIAEAVEQIGKDEGIIAAVLTGEAKTIKESEGLEDGMVDRLIEGDLLAGAVAFAREIAAKPVPKTRERSGKLGTAEQNAPIFAVAREIARKKQRGMIAPLAAIDAVEAATKLPFDEGCKLEQKLFPECLF